MAPSTAEPLFHGRRFYLMRIIAPQRRQQVRELIEGRGGEVTGNPRDSIQLVDQEHLDPRQDWVSVDFVLDSAARGALQDLSDYMGQELTPASPVREEQPPRRSNASSSRRQRRIKYSAEDDARMLLYLQSNFGRLNKSMESVPLSVWESAARKKVTNHTGQSMHEHYRKQLRTKTPTERREIISKELKRAKGRATESDSDKEKDEVADDIEDETEDEDDAPAPAATRATTNIPTTTSEQPRPSPTATAASRWPKPPVARDTPNHTDRATRSGNSPAARESSSDSSSEDEEEEGDARDKKRLRRTTLEKEPALSNGAPPTSSEPPAVSSLRRRLRRHSSPMRPLGRLSLHRESNRRQTLGVVTRSSTRGAGVTPPLLPSVLTPNEEEKEEKEEEKDGEEQGDASRTQASASGDARGERGIFFSSVWADAFADPSNRRRLHDLFEPAAVSSPPSASRVTESPAESSPPSASRVEATPAESASPVAAPAEPASPVAAPAEPASPAGVQTTPERQHRSPESDATATPQTTRKRSLSDAGVGEQAPPESAPPVEVEYSTKRELDALLCRIQFETKANLQTIVHALYYSSGNYATAKAFLEGQSPAGMWSPQDDLLLANLMNEATTRADVESAARDGAFASMRVQRGVGDILARIRYLL